MKHTMLKHLASGSEKKEAEGLAYELPASPTVLLFFNVL
jgi:hypothetical protein